MLRCPRYLAIGAFFLCAAAQCGVTFAGVKRSQRTFTAARRAQPRRPGCIVFDLDGCLWYPDMYELWGGGAPFTEQQVDGTLIDRSGRAVTLHSGSEVHYKCTRGSGRSKFEANCVFVVRCKSWTLQYGMGFLQQPPHVAMNQRGSTSSVDVPARTKDLCRAQIVNFGTSPEARECLAKFHLAVDPGQGDGKRLKDVVQIAQIHKGSKTGHMREIAAKCRA
eukprot:1506110-Amphidinium_carterae.1